VRTAYNTVVYEIHDYGMAFTTPTATWWPMRRASLFFTRGNDHGIKEAVAFIGADNMNPGDVFLLNYRIGRGAYPRPVVFAPIHVDDELVGFSSCRIHVLDLKQKDPGYVLDSTDMYQEGLFFPASKLYRAGKPTTTSSTSSGSTAVFRAHHRDLQAKCRHASLVSAARRRLLPSTDQPLSPRRCAR